MELSHISKAYGSKPVLQDLTLSFPQGGRWAVMAPSGTGKTTLLRILLGLEAPDSGTVSGVPHNTAAVFQEDRLCKNLTVRGNLRMVLGRSYREAEAVALLARLGLENCLDLPASQLSGGMARRVALARALLTKPALLILDEPFTGLDEAARLRCAEAIRDLPGDITVLLVTHREEDAALLGAKILRLQPPPPI